MARQKKRADGNYKRSFSYMGNRYYIYGKTQQELNEKELAKRNEIEQSNNYIFNPTLNQYYEHFTELRRNEVKESTLRAQQIQFRTMAAVELASGIIFGNMHIKEITRRDIEIARDTLLKQGKTPQHLNICFSHLNHVFNAAELDDTISKNPCKALKKLKRTEPTINETKHRALTVDETKRFFEAAEQRNSYYLNAFLVMIKTGLRIGELAALHAIDIDKKNGFIHVRRTVSRDETGSYYISDSTKTGSSCRDIPLTSEIKAIIEEQKDLNRSIWGLSSNDTLFKSSEGDLLRDYTANREIERICKVANIKKFTCHAFRNTFATRFIEQRPQDYKILSEILGHKNTSITLDLYTHVMQENKITAMNELSIKIS